MIKLKRIYDEPAHDDGFRILVDRLWPRGMTKEHAKIDFWMKEIAPSDDLRTWFDHDHDKWPEFLKRYTKELVSNPRLQELRDIASRRPVVTFLYSSKERQYNNAVALRGIVAAHDR